MEGPQGVKGDPGESGPPGGPGKNGGPVSIILGLFSVKELLCWTQSGQKARKLVLSLQR